MIENCCLYLPIQNPPLKKLLPGCKSDGGLLRSASWFQYQLEGEGVKLSVMPETEINGHLQGFRGYVSQLRDNELAKAEAMAAISQVKSVLGVSFDRPVDEDSPLFKSLFFILQQFKGFMFINDSIILADGRGLVGPMAQLEDQAEPENNLTLDREDFRHQRDTTGLNPELVAMREKHYFVLAQGQFRCARWLPIRSLDDTQLRPLNEIAARACALNLLFHWVVFTQMADVMLQAFVERNALQPAFTADELALLARPRSEVHETEVNNIGWKLENLWALCWVLGFDPAPPFDQGQLPTEITQSMIFGFLPDFLGDTGISTERFKPRSLREVLELEDLYYCAHNAVRSAQTGDSTVPRGFHPISDGGAIHERRHALSWCISPDSNWDDVDLST